MCLGLRVPWIECGVRYVGYILACTVIRYWDISVGMEITVRFEPVL